MISQIKKALENYKTITLNDDSQSRELEIRLGKFKKNFIPGVKEISFKKILQLFNDWNECEIDETIFKHIPEKQRKNIGWILKDKVYQCDNRQENIRISLNLETVYTFKDILERHNASNNSFTKEQIQMFRKKKRYSRIFEKIWKLDLTKVEVFKIENNNWVKDGIVYECEIELSTFDTIDNVIQVFENLWKKISPIHYGSMIYPFYSHLVKSNKFIGNQPKTLERENMFLLTKDYMVTDKADGQRMFLISTPKGLFLIDNLLNSQPYYFNQIIPEGTLIDGEYVDGKFLAFDCLFYKNQDVRKLHLLERLDILSVINVETKIFVDIKDINNLWEKRNNFGYRLDGLIFTPKYEGYDGNILKWKDEHTIDVYVDTNKNLYAWSSKEKSNVLLDSFFKPTNVVKTLDISPNIQENCIVELTYDPIDDVWLQKKIRNDKTKPNAILTIMGVIKAISDNITINDIKTSLESEYKTPGKTKKEREETLDIQYRKFHNQVKNFLIQYPEKNRKYLLDLGCGKGGDIMKWIKAGYTDVLAIDNSHTHIYGPNGFNERYEKVKNKINITFIWGDVTKPLADCGLNEIEKDKIKPWLSVKFDMISCQFAIHYFLSDKNMWMMFMRNIQLFLKQGGYFVGTFLNAHHLEKLDNEHHFKINDKIFYTLKHNNPTYIEYNQKNLIHRYLAFWKTKRDKIKIHTSEWNDEIEENVIFPEHLEMLLEKCKLTKVANDSFVVLIEKFKPSLLKDEELLSSLHNYFIYQQDKGHNQQK